ncbi:sulfonate ABC transporter substrate-binding protein [Lonepinella koalarum]
MRITTTLKKAFTALFTAAVSFGAVSQAQADTLRIGYQKDSLALIKAKDSLEKHLSEKGVDVKWTEFPGGPQLLEGLNVGSIDFGVTGETPPVFAQAAKADLIYVAHDASSPTSEAIVVPKNSPITNVADLKGKKVAFNRGSNVHYLIVRALQEAGLKYSDIEPAYLPPSDARAAFERGSVDAWVIWDPYLAAAEQQLGARILRDATGLADNHEFYLSNGTYAKNNPEVINILVEQIRHAGEWIKANVDQATKEFAPVFGLPEGIIKTTIERHHYDTQVISPEVAIGQQKIADVFTDLKLIPVKLKIDDVVWKPAQ